MTLRPNLGENSPHAQSLSFRSRYLPKVSHSYYKMNCIDLVFSRKMKCINLVLAFMLIGVVLISMMNMVNGRPHNNHWSTPDGCHCDTSSSWSGDYHCHCPLGTHWSDNREKEWERPWEKIIIFIIFLMDTRLSNRFLKTTSIITEENRNEVHCLKT